MIRFNKKKFNSIAFAILAASQTLSAAENNNCETLRNQELSQCNIARDKDTQKCAPQEMSCIKPVFMKALKCTIDAFNNKSECDKKNLPPSPILKQVPQ